MSVCAHGCERGYYRAYQDQMCCWTCIPCDISTSIIVDETRYRVPVKAQSNCMFSCVQCDLGWVPNSQLSACRPIKPVHLEWSSGWALVPAIYATCGLCATLFVISVFVRFNDTPVVRWVGWVPLHCLSTIKYRSWPLDESSAIVCWLASLYATSLLSSLWGVPRPPVAPCHVS